MNSIQFIKTDDSSTGLYNEDVKDIYHSKTGAKKESLEKFIIPSNLYYFEEKLKRKIEILDICYGIGYNTKTVLEYSRKKNINITCIDKDKSLAILSPMIKDNTEDNELRIFIIEMLKSNGIKSSDMYDVLDKYCTLKNIDFFIDATIDFKACLNNFPYKYSAPVNENQKLHNIYYNYISSSMERSQNTSKYKNCNLTFIFGDARGIINNFNNKKFDIIFLDAFSPQKDPTLWTYNFLSKIKTLMHDDSILVTYSKSTPFRSTLHNLGFNIRKTFINNIDMGTSASLNNSSLISNITDFDLSLYKTRSGIFYYDNNFSLTPNEIINNRILAQNSSDRVSHTKFLKKYY